MGGRSQLNAGGGIKLVSEQKEKCFGEESLGNDWLFTRLEEEEESKKVESDAKDRKFC